MGLVLFFIFPANIRLDFLQGAKAMAKQSIVRTEQKANKDLTPILSMRLDYPHSVVE